MFVELSVAFNVPVITGTAEKVLISLIVCAVSLVTNLSLPVVDRLDKSMCAPAEILTSPEPRTELPLIVLIFVPDTSGA